jgi:hypothetical protein
MRYQVLTGLWLGLTIGFAPSHVARAQSLTLTVSCEKSEYQPCEPIIVTSTVRNHGNVAVAVREPSAIAAVVSYSVYREGAGGEELVAAPVMGSGNPAWGARVVNLEPGEQLSSSCELARIFGFDWCRELKSGEYILRTKYHLSNYGTTDYDSKVVSAESRFRLAEWSQSELEVLGMLTQCAQLQSGASRDACLESILTKYPASSQRTGILVELANSKSRQRDSAGSLGVYTRLLGEKLSVEFRNCILYTAAQRSAELGQVPLALDFLSKCSLPESATLLKRDEGGQL